MLQTLSEFPKKHVELLFSDEQPMRELIVKLQQKEFANEVFVSTSHRSFLIQVSTNYQPDHQHDFVSVSFVERNNCFFVKFFEMGRKSTEEILNFSEALHRIEILVLKMKMLAQN